MAESDYMSALRGIFPHVPTPAFQAPNFREGSCYRCGQAGHWSNECTLPQSAGGTGTPTNAWPPRYCPCGSPRPCDILTSRTEKNPGRQFYRCPEPQKCQFFEWCDSGPMPPCPACREPCAILTSRTEKNPGRKYYKCNPCNFFQWCDGAQNSPVIPRTMGSPQRPGLVLPQQQRYEGSPPTYGSPQQRYEASPHGSATYGSPQGPQGLGYSPQGPQGLGYSPQGPGYSSPQGAGYGPQGPNYYPGPQGLSPQGPNLNYHGPQGPNYLPPQGSDYSPQGPGNLQLHGGSPQRYPGPPPGAYQGPDPSSVGSPGTYYNNSGWNFNKSGIVPQALDFGPPTPTSAERPSSSWTPNGPPTPTSAERPSSSWTPNGPRRTDFGSQHRGANGVGSSAGSYY